ncbi:hypothetical protein Y047_6069 [Burkholderia pseudomallei MSHR3016]|nr:hypothetical protein Y047_6069 [Burkholderia pseudomallei MSHR3016]
MRCEVVADDSRLTPYAPLQRSCPAWFTLRRPPAGENPPRSPRHPATFGIGDAVCRLRGPQATHEPERP